MSLGIWDATGERKKIFITTLKKLKISGIVYILQYIMHMFGFFSEVLLLLFICWAYFVSEKAMAPHSSTLARKIPWTEEPGRLQSMGSLRVGYD